MTNNDFELPALISHEELMKRTGLNIRPKPLEVEASQPQNFKNCQFLAEENSEKGFNSQGTIEIIRETLEWKFNSHFYAEPYFTGNLVVCKKFGYALRVEELKDENGNCGLYKTTYSCCNARINPRYSCPYTDARTGPDLYNP